MGTSFRIHLGLLLTGLAAGCSSPWAAQSLLPSDYTVTSGSLSIHTDSPVPADRRLIEELVARRGDLESSLGILVSGQPIQVYLFHKPADFQKYLDAHPEVPRRRAFFLETENRLEVYAQSGERLAEDLRHEVAHAYLHSAVANLPLWLDEGVAEYSEAPRGQHGLNRAHLEMLLARLQKTNWRPSLARLERFPPTSDMSQEEYAESWAWVHWLVEADPALRSILQTYLEDLARDSTTPPLSQRLRTALGDPERALVDHLLALPSQISQDG